MFDHEGELAKAIKKHNSKITDVEVTQYTVEFSVYSNKVTIVDIAKLIVTLKNIFCFETYIHESAGLSMVTFQSIYMLGK